jgi:hypothetical protein
MNSAEQINDAESHTSPDTVKKQDVGRQCNISGNGGFINSNLSPR